MPKVKELTEEDIKILREIEDAANPIPVGVPSAEPGVDVVMTQAELILAKERGAEVGALIPTDFPEGHVPEGGQQLFKIGKGDSQFSATVVDDDLNHQYVWVYTHEGRRYAVQKAKLLYYLGKGFLARPPAGVKVPPSTVPCFSKRLTADGKPCPKKFRTIDQAEQHFMFRHRAEWQQQERDREREQRERSIQIQEAQLEVMQRLAAGQVVSPTEAKALGAIE